MGDFGCGGGGWTLALKMDGSKVDSFREEILPKVTPSNDLLPLPYVLLSLFLQLLFYGSFRFISFQAYFLRYWLTIFGWEISHFLASGKSTALGKGSSLWKNILGLVLKCGSESVIVTPSYPASSFPLTASSQHAQYETRARDVKLSLQMT